MIVSVHLAELPRRTALRLKRRRIEGVPGLRYAALTVLAPLGPALLPKPTPGSVGLIAGWEDEEALEGFLSGGHPVAEQLADGWRVRLTPMRIWGAWPELGDVVPEEQPMEDDEPAAVITLGRLRLTQGYRFLRTSAAAEDLAVRDPALIASTGLARPPRIVATFSLWRTTAAMRAYAIGAHAPAHQSAVREHAHRSFHHQAAFMRFRPYGAEGTWEGREPLSEALGAPAAARAGG